MNKIFISYSRKDETFARQLATLLDQAGAEVWLDVKDIPAGVKWSNAIQQGLDAAELMLLVVSASSMASKNVEDEWQYYLDKGKPIIPVLLEKVGRPYQLNRLQWIDFSDPQSNFLMTYPKLLAELNRNGFSLQSPVGTAPYQIKPAPAAASAAPASGSAPTAGSGSNRLLWIGAAVVAILIVIGALVLLNRPSAPAATATPTESTAAAAIPSDTPAVTTQTTDASATPAATNTPGASVPSSPVAGGHLDVSLAFSDADSLTLVVKGDSDLSGLAFKTTTKTVVLADSFDALQFSSQAAAGTCLRFVRSGQTPPLPRACDSQKTYVSETANADVFWYDLVSNRLTNLVLMRGEEQIGLCSAAVAAGGGCHFQS